MKRKDFLKRLGLVGIGATLPGFALAKDIMDEPSNQELLDSCTVIPNETAGPYPAPSSIGTATLVRTDITESTQTGIPLSLTLTIVNTDANCAALNGLRVDIWHCNKRGYYSAYSGQPGIDGTQDTTGQTWLRGIQYTNANGQVTFTSIYPGWYTPRATHIHVQVYSGTTLLATSQLAFPDAINTTVNSYYNTSGTNSFTNSNDMVFSDSYANELMDVTGSTTAGYVATKQIGVSAGTLGTPEFELETGGQFGNLKNYPNPFTDKTVISFYLLQSSNVRLSIFDVAGKTITENDYKNLDSGQQNITLSKSQLNLQAGVYIYKLAVSNGSGTFVQSKKMIVL